MENIHIENFKGKHVHFIGIGGISMSGLAEILHIKGYKISGSDLQHSAITDRLKANGIVVYEGHTGNNIDGADLIVYTAAVKEDNPEMIETKKRMMPYMDRATLLGQIMKTFSYAIGVSGTHGKTTTTSMLSIILDQANLDPTILVGGELDAIGGNVRTGNSNYFITEACEYVESFLKFHPYMALILNIDSDHLDYFRDLDHIYSAFVKYAELVPNNGYIIGCSDDPLVAKLMQGVQCRIVSYGIDNNADWTAHDISYDDSGCATFRVKNNQNEIGLFILKVPGKHNVYNALAALAASFTIGISIDVIKEALLNFHGTHRRFEIKGTTDNGVIVIDDYAHHPTEVKATLKAALNYPHNRIWCVFQPHTYTRTRKLFKEFVGAFSDVDSLIIADIYAAREVDTGDIHSKTLANAIADNNQSCVYLPSFESIVTYLKEHLEPNDLVITMGAGNIYQVGESLLKS